MAVHEPLVSASLRSSRGHEVHGDLDFHPYSRDGRFCARPDTTGCALYDRCPTPSALYHNDRFWVEVCGGFGSTSVSTCRMGRADNHHGYISAGQRSSLYLRWAFPTGGFSRTSEYQIWLASRERIEDHSLSGFLLQIARQVDGKKSRVQIIVQGILELNGDSSLVND